MQLMQPEQQLKKVLFRRGNSGSFIRECRYVGKNNLKEDELIGAMIISRAILAPLRRIAENAGINGAVIIEKFNNKNLRSVITLLRILLVCMRKV
jgi:chaperonin GroEL (HSP60 family)